MATAGSMTGVTASLLSLPRIQVLLLHHLFPDEEYRFRALLSTLARTHRFIAYSEAVRRIRDGTAAQINHPYIAFTFDDGLKSCLRAATILGEFGVKACFFVCPGIIGETDPARITEFCTARLELPRPVEFMTWDDVARLRDAGHEIGAHTMNHVNLAQVPHREAVDEITRSIAALRSRFGPVRHFAWTYGRFWHVTPLAIKAAFEAGCESCASGERGAHPPDVPPPRSGAGASGTSQVQPHSASPRTWSQRFCIRRDHVIAAWPIAHTCYLMARSARTMSPANRNWPARWGDRIG